MLPSGELFEEPSARDGRWDGSTVAGAVTNRTADFKSGTGEHFEGARRHRGTCSGRDESHRSDLNRRPLDYESSALPLSYCGRSTRRGRTAVRPRIEMPWRGFEPRRLSALPPQDSVSTSFTTRACGRAR